MPDVLDWQTIANPRSAVHRAVQALQSGRLVAFPTETVYGIAASPLVPDAVERLGRCKGRPDDKPFTLAISGADEALDWVPGLGTLGRRLARRCWPGPVTLVCGDGVDAGLAARLPPVVRPRLCPQGAIGLRAPAHQAVLHVLHVLPAPLLLTSANRGGEADATTADAVIQAVGDHLDLVIDDGPSRYGQPSTVVGVNGASWKLLREGVVPAATLERLSACVIVFVCTGNTCRSPLAEALAKKLLAARMGCPVEDLPRRGFVVLSAGLAAMMGGKAAAEAVEAARELGADLAGHSSQPLTPQLAAQADYLVAMTSGHLLALDAQFPDLGNRARLLAGGGEDVPDPIGCDQQVYRDCAQQIMRHLEEFLPEFQQS